MQAQQEAMQQEQLNNVASQAATSFAGNVQPENLENIGPALSQLQQQIGQ